MNPVRTRTSWNSMVGRAFERVKPLRHFPPIRRMLQSAQIRRIALLVEGALPETPEERQYQAWIAQRLRTRGKRYPYRSERGLLSLLTTIWNTPLEYLQPLTRSVLEQTGDHDFEWVVLDNGCTDQPVVEYINDVLRPDPRVRLTRVAENIGIMKGMHHVLQQARGRYVCPVDSDDFLYPDCLSIVSSQIQSNGYPPILYSDEDFLVGDRFIDPYFKPEWDPVLFVNSAYIAHLGVIDRKRAVELGVYTDHRINGSHDWDTFTRFVGAGHVPIHIPEVLYSWRRHDASTAGNIRSKTYIYESQRLVLERFLEGNPQGRQHTVEMSPFFDGMPDWYFRREKTSGRPLLTVVLGDGQDTECEQVRQSTDYANHTIIAARRDTTPEAMLELLRRHCEPGGLVAFLSGDLEIERSDWVWHVHSVMELHPETAVVGGRIYDQRGRLLDAGQYLGFGAGCETPDRFRSRHDPGYRAQLWKQKSVSAVPLQFSVLDSEFVIQFFESCGDRMSSLRYANAWIGAFAIESGRRVVYSPFLVGTSPSDWSLDVLDSDYREFLKFFGHFVPDRRYYPEPLGLSADNCYRAVA